MRGATRVSQEDIGHCVNCGKDSSGFHLFVLAGFVLFSQKASASVLMYSTYFGALFRTLLHINERNKISISAREVAQRVLRARAERTMFGYS